MSAKASDPPAQLGALERALGRAGVRLTGARRTIMSVVAGMARPFTASELTEAVYREDPTIGRASVFRSLVLLQDHGYVERLHSLGTEHYTLCLEEEHHHHLTCVDCGNTTQLAVGQVDQALDRVVRERGYLPKYHLLEVYGLCPACRA